MKLVNKALILLVILLSSMETSLANELNNKRELISIEATRYEIRFQNISKHSLRVIVRDRETLKSQFFLINPGQISQFRGNFDKQRLLDLEVMSVYDFQTFRDDLKRLNQKILLRNKNNPTKTLQIKRADWYTFANNFINHKDVSNYVEEFDFTQLTIKELDGKELASTIANKVSKDRTIISENERTGYFAGSSISTSKAAVAVVLSMAYQAAEFGFKDQIPYLRSMLEWLSDKRFIQSNRDLVFHKADGLDLRTTTPMFSVSFSPIYFIQNLNDSWLAPTELGFDPDKVIGQGFFNNTLQFQVSGMISPEFEVIPNLAYARLYGSLIYQRLSYELNSLAVYDLSSNYLATVTNPPAETYTISSLDDIALQTTGLGVSASLRTMFKDFIFIDLEGGFLSRSGRLNFGQEEGHFNDEPDVLQITYDGRKVTEGSPSAFGKIKAGLGYNTQKGAGIYISAGFGAFQSNITPNDDYQIYLRTSQNTIDQLPILSKSWMLSMNFGVEVMF